MIRLLGYIALVVIIASVGLMAVFAIKSLPEIRRYIHIKRM